MNLDRATGALLGLAVGDALGTTLEFSAPEAPPFPELASGPHRDITGGGPFHVAPGQVTDDTHMATCLASSLRELDRFDSRDVARRYREWSRVAFDIGAQTKAALGELDAELTRDPTEAGRRVWEARRQPPPAGNGSLMRTAPIGVALAADPIARRAAAMADSAITHFEFRCQLACAAFDAAIGEMAADGPDAMRPRSVLDLVVAELLAAATDLLRTYPEYADEIGEARRELVEDVELAGQRDPDLYGAAVHLHRTQGYVRVAFRLALWELVHAPSYEAGVIDAVNRGGDADTNGAIVGALLGAFHGATSIPATWTDTVMGALADRPGPLRDRYHPQQLLGLVRR